VVQRASSLKGGYAFYSQFRQPLSHSKDWCFTPLPGSGWQVLFDSQHGLIGSQKSDTLQKLVAEQPQPEPNPQKGNFVDWRAGPFFTKNKRDKNRQHLLCVLQIKFTS
jgi:hypothetical protein